MKMIDFKPYVRYLIMAGVVLILGSILINKACRSPYETKEYLELKGHFERYKKETEKKNKVLQGEAKDAKEEIRKILRENEDLEKEKNVFVQESIEANKNLEVAEQDLEILKEEAKELRDLPDKYKNLQKQNENLAKQFSLMRTDRDAEKNQRISTEDQNKNLTKALSEKDKIIASLEAQLSDEIHLREICEGMVKKGEGGSLWKKTESVLVYGFAIYGAVEAGKKVFK